MTRHKPKTAEEFLAELNADPAHVARRAAQNDRREMREAEIALATQQLRDELSAAGYPVGTLDDLAKRYAPLSAQLVEVLLRWIPIVDDKVVKEQLVRALAVAENGFDGGVLASEFQRSPDAALRYAIANTLATARVRGAGTWILDALNDPSSGTARQMLALAAARRSPREDANRALLRLLDELPGHAALGLAESGGGQELAVLERRYPSAKGWVKKEIGRAISVIKRRLNQGQ